MTITSTDTIVTSATLENNEYSVLNGTPSLDLRCTIILSRPIGPNHSALVVTWLHAGMNVSSHATQSSSGGPLSNMFISSLRLNTLQNSHEGQYCCHARVHNTTISNNTCATLTIAGNKKKEMNIYLIFDIFYTQFYFITPMQRF